MKSLAKLSLLLALVVAGRYLRPTAARSVSAPVATAPAQPETLRFASFTTGSALPVAPVSHRTLPAARRAAPDSLAWF